MPTATKCDHCPLRDREQECPAISAKHPRYCAWVDPDGDGYKPGGADVLLNLASAPKPSTAFPSLLTQARNLAGAVVDAVASGLEPATPEERERRLAICGACDQFTDGRCRQCGCHMPYKVTLAAWHCPIDKW